MWLNKKIEEMQLIVIQFVLNEMNHFGMLIDIYTSLPVSQVQLSKYFLFLHSRSLIHVLMIQQFTAAIT